MEDLAKATGLSEPALRLFVGVLISYPLSLVYRVIPRDAHTLKHLFCAVKGMSIAWFCYGTEKGGIIHSLASILLTYFTLMIFNSNRTIGLFLCFVGNLTHLLLGYWFSATENYDIDFTTAQCVLTLRLIGLAFDYFDGSKQEKDLERDQKENQLKTLPNLLEVFGFCYFYASFLIGPQFTFRRYRDFITEKIYEDPTSKDSKSRPGVPLWPALSRLLLGAVYLAIFTVLSPQFPSSYMNTQKYAEEPLFIKIYFMWMVGFLSLRKYLGIWLLGEGALVLVGIAFNGRKNGVPQWDGLSNVKPYVFETCLTLHKLVEAFNVTTNDWVKRYVFKRLKFMNNRHISSFSALGFLAVWHGFSAGYFVSFFMEFIGVEGERAFLEIIDPFVNFAFSNTFLMVPVALAGWLLRTFMFYYGFAPFELKTLPHVWNFLTNTYFLYFIFVIGARVLHSILISSKKPKRA